MKPQIKKFEQVRGTFEKADADDRSIFLEVTCLTLNKIRVDGFNKPVKRWDMRQDVQTQQTIDSALGWQIMTCNLNISYLVSHAFEGWDLDQRRILNRANRHNRDASCGDRRVAPNSHRCF